MPRFRLPALLLALVLCSHTALAQDADQLLQQFNTAYSAAVAADEAGDLQAALPQWRQAFQAIDQFEETEEIVPFKEQVLFKLGETHRLLGKQAKDQKERKEHYDKAADIFQNLLERAVLAVYERDDILLQQGYIFSDTGKRMAETGSFKDALQQQQKAVQIFTSMNNPARRDDPLARENSAISRTYRILGSYQQALQAATQALQYWHQAGEQEELRREQNAIATIKLEQGRLAEAAGELENLLEADPEAKDLIQASAAFNLGNCLQILGEYQRAQALLARAGSMAKNLDNAEFNLEIANTQGIVDYSLGLFQEAMNNFDLAAASTDNQLRAKALLNSVAVAIASLQEDFDFTLFQQAELDATESMAIAQTMDDPRTALAAIQNMGRLQFELASAPAGTKDAQGQRIDKQQRVDAFASSLQYLNRALSKAEQIRDQAAGFYEYSDIASNIGDVLLHLAGAGLNGQVNTSGLCPDAPLLQCSLSQYRLALDNARKIQAMEQLWQAHLGVGRAYRALGNMPEAARHLQQAIEIIESMRGALGGAQAAGFLRNRSEAYTELIDLLLKQWSQLPPDSTQAAEKAQEALVYLERSRLAALKGLFEQALPAKRQKQGRVLAAMDYRLQRLQLNPESHAQEIQELERKRSELLKTLQQGDPFLHKPTLDLEAVREKMPADLAVLTWYYNDEHIFVWNVNKKSISLHKTPRKIGAGRRARDLIDDYIPLFGERIAGGDVGSLLATFYKQLFDATGLELSPNSVSRLAVVPYGALASLPFGAFVTNKQSNAFLLQDFEVQYLYAVGQLLLEPPAASGSLLAVGNPDLPGYFGREVPLVRRQDVAEDKRGQESEENRDRGVVPDLTVLPYEEAAFIYRMLNPEDYAPTVQPVRSNRAFGFNSLPDAGEEVQAIEKDFKDRGLGETAAVADSSVTETVLLQQMHETPRQYVHLATHGKLLPKSPLDSFLVFSEDPQAESGYKSGLLTVRQIREELFGDLAGARLCTLSCCETALRGKGMGLELASLAAAFQSAGAAMVVASLWEVPSKATSLLMQRFYIHLFDGMMVPNAIRQAQLEMAAHEEYASPFYWAAFIPIGVDPGQKQPENKATPERQPDNAQKTETTETS